MAYINGKEVVIVSFSYHRVGKSVGCPESLYPIAFNDKGKGFTPKFSGTVHESLFTHKYVDTIKMQLFKQSDSTIYIDFMYRCFHPESIRPEAFEAGVIEVLNSDKKLLESYAIPDEVYLNSYVKLIRLAKLDNGMWSIEPVFTAVSSEQVVKDLFHR